MIKRRPKPPPDLDIEPVAVGRVHLVKEATHQVVVTKCGLIVDTRAKRDPVLRALKTTIWNDYDCGDCLAVRPLQRA